jgi:hypothetical protein
VDLSQKERLFQKYYDRLIVEALHAGAHLNLWERLEKYKATSYIDELNQAPYFYTFTTKAHLENVLVTLSRILDRHEDSLSIWKFLDFAEQNRKIFSTGVFQQRMIQKPDYDEYWVKSHTPITLQEIEDDRERLAKLEQTVKNLDKWRNKVIAHTDRQFLLAGKIVSKEYPLQLQQLQEVIDTLFEILNRYSGAYDSSSYAEGYPGEDDIQFVMDCIRFYIQEQDRQIEAELEALKRQARDGK